MILLMSLKSLATRMRLMSAWCLRPGECSMHTLTVLSGQLGSASPRENQDPRRPQSPSSSSCPRPFSRGSVPSVPTVNIMVPVSRVKQVPVSIIGPVPWPPAASWRSPHCPWSPSSPTTRWRRSRPPPPTSTTPASSGRSGRSPSCLRPNCVICCTAPPAASTTSTAEITSR